VVVVPLFPVLDPLAPVLDPLAPVLDPPPPVLEAFAGFAELVEADAPGAPEPPVELCDDPQPVASISAAQAMTVEQALFIGSFTLA
jgi:hypothetical protein